MFFKKDWVLELFISAEKTCSNTKTIWILLEYEKDIIQFLHLAPIGLTDYLNSNSKSGKSRLRG